MAKNDEFQNLKPVLKGKVISNPTYLPQELNEYENNPYIKALPPIFDDNDLIDRFTLYPVMDAQEKLKKKNIRYHMIKRVKNFTQPLNLHFEIERNISTMIRRGYLARNPCSSDFLKRLDLINKVKEEKVDNRCEKLEELGNVLRTTADSLSIIGISGIGKTTAIERIIQMYPQVIYHNEYKDYLLTRTQIVWLKLDCPFDGSLKTLCKLFFRAIDDVLGTTRYFEKYGNNRNSTATMMIHMTYLASVYSIGLLVIDEMQHLINPKNNPDEMLNFFVTFVNVIGIPTILVGTFKALKVLKKDFRQARRAGSEGNIIWDRMKKNEEWDFFIETLWDFQWLRNSTPLTDKLNQVIYDESQGITAIAVNLFIIAQGRALYSADEKLTERLFRDTAKKDLHMIQPMILALRENRLEDLSKYEDITINLDEILLNIEEKIDLRGKINERMMELEKQKDRKKNNIIENLIIDLSSMGIFNQLTQTELEEIISQLVNEQSLSEEYIKVKQQAVEIALQKNQEKQKKKEEVKRKQEKTAHLGDDDLRKIYQNAVSKKQHVYDLLKEKGYIKNPVEEFLKAE